MLQLEPSALRKPDEINAPSHLTANGGRLPATLYRLAHTASGNVEETGERVFAKVAERLSDLIGDMNRVWVDRDDRREMLTLTVAEKDGTEHPARALSDGTLRFLALCVFQLDPAAKGVLCLEEPESGIHPQRIPAMLKLLQDIAVDSNRPVGDDNPLRQVLVNTHSPTVVGEAPEDSLLLAETVEDARGDQRFKKVTFSCLSSTWRTKSPETAAVVSKRKLMDYLNPTPSGLPKHTPRIKRVADRDDFQMRFPFDEN